jgi:hypothetical protein
MHEREKRNAYKVLVWKVEVKKAIGRGVDGK